MKFKSEESHQRVLDSQKRGLETYRKNNKIKEEEYYKNPKPCKQCGKPIIYDRRNKNEFCSHSCSASYNNIGVCRNFGGNLVEIIKNKRKSDFCLFCGKEIKRKNRKYCSSQCQQSLTYEKYIKKIKDEVIVSNNVLRRYLMIIYNSKYQKCEWGIPNPISGTVCLDMHHIDGNAHNNILSNVELLCPNCHSLTNTYKNVDTNRKSTRINRKT